MSQAKVIKNMETARADAVDLSMEMLNLLKELDAASENLVALRKENVQLRLKMRQLTLASSATATATPLPPLIRQSKKMNQVLLACENIAARKEAVLIHGEPGSGKSLLADYIASLGPRKKKPYFRLCCGEYPGPLLEEAIFGWIEGERPGFLALADEGTLFIDQIDLCPIPLQHKLLSYLKDGEYYKKNSTKVSKSDVRILAAAEQPLASITEKGLFLPELFYALNALFLIAPPLRNRKEDIIPLARCFLEGLNHRHGLRKTLSPEALSLLRTRDYPGNARDLRLLIEDAYQVTGGEEILPSCFPVVAKEPAPPSYEEGDRTLRALLEEYEQRILVHYLKEVKTEEALAKKLGISQSTISRKLAKCQAKGKRNRDK